MNNNASKCLRHHARRLLFAWLALMALMLLSLGSAHMPLGSWNVAIGLAIAALKAAIVAALFMELLAAEALLRIVAAAGLFTLALLVGLSGLDFATRASGAAAMQPPQQLRPLLAAGEGR